MVTCERVMVPEVRALVRSRVTLRRLSEALMREGRMRDAETVAGVMEDLASVAGSLREHDAE